MPKSKAGGVLSASFIHDLSSLTNIFLECDVNYLYQLFLSSDPLGNIEPRLVTTFRHELTHFLDMEMSLSLERRKLRLQRWRSSTLSNLGLDPSLPINSIYLVDVIDNLRSEGLATFNGITSLKKFGFMLAWIYEWRKIVTKMTKTVDDSELKALYNQASQSAYALGDLMFSTGLARWMGE